MFFLAAFNISYSLYRTAQLAQFQVAASMTISHHYSGSFICCPLNVVLLLITFKALNNLAPSYISNLLHLYTPNRLLRSSSKFQLQVPPSNLKTYGDRAFSVCAPKLWNCLPYHIRCSPSVSAFKSSLKTYFFKRYFISQVM